eukprot:scaffold21269_cov119-Isochrysis_galbana.AAC.7
MCRPAGRAAESAVGGPGQNSKCCTGGGGSGAAAGQRVAGGRPQHGILWRSRRRCRTASDVPALAQADLWHVPE